MKPTALAVALAATIFSADTRAASLADLAFLKGNWTSDRSGFVIEESWTDAKAGVVLGMSRGAQNGAVRFLRFAVVEQAGDTVIMRFKRYNADYSAWKADGPSVMRLASAERNQAVFEATDPASDVRRIVYRARDDGAVDVIANRVDETGPYLVEFTLRQIRSAAFLPTSRQVRACYGEGSTPTNNQSARNVTKFVLKAKPRPCGTL